MKELSRRHFIASSLAASIGLSSAAADGAGAAVIEKPVDVKTPDGACDAAFFHPSRGAHPGVLIWHDSMGLRPVFHELGKRIAAEGYSVLVPNLYYREAKAQLPTSRSSTRRSRSTASAGSALTVTASAAPSS